MTTSLRRVLLLAGVLTGVACASLPPAQPARDLNAIVGRWEGTLRLRSGSTYKAKMEITENGRFVTMLDQPIPSLGTTFPGTVTIESGRFRYLSEVNGATGTLSLHDGDGKRVLTSRSDNGASAGEYHPATP